MIGALTVGAAHAAACCGSGPPVDPGSLGPDEQVGLAVGLSAAATPWRWSADGHLGPAGGGELGLALSGRVRVSRALQVGLLVPGLARAADGTVDAGVGEGGLVARVDPLLQRNGVPRPVLIAGVLAPAGVRSDDLPPWWRVVLAPGLELQGERLAASAWSSLSLATWAPGQPTVRPGLGWELGASAGPRGDWGSLTAGLGVRGTTSGWVDGAPAGAGAAAPLTRLGLALPLGEDTRLTAASTLMPPVPGLGRNADLWLGANAAVLRTW